MDVVLWQGFQALINLMNKLPVENPVMPTLLQVFTDLVNTARGASLDIGWDICPEDFVEKVRWKLSKIFGLSFLLLIYSWLIQFLIYIIFKWIDVCRLPLSRYLTV